MRGAARGSFRSFHDAFLSEYRVVCLAPEVRAQQGRVKRHAVGVYPPDAQPLQELAAPLPVERRELVVGGLSVQRRARVAVDVGDHPVDLLLPESVERGPLGHHAADEQVVVLDVRLLRRAVRVAEEHPRAALEPRRVVLRVRPEELDHLRVGELRAVVGEDGGEERHEELQPRDVLEHVEDARRRLRGPRVPEEGEHQPAGEHHRVQRLAPGRAHDGVDLHRLHAEVEPEEREVVLVGPPDAALRVCLRDRPALLWRPAAAHEGHVPPLRVEELRVGVVVDAPFAEPVEGLGPRGHHGADRLPSAQDGVLQRGVHVGHHALVGLRPAPCVAEDAPVVGLRGVRDVEALPERAGVLLVAPVADVRRPAELRTHPADVVLAHLEAFALALERDLPPVRVAVGLRARLEVRAYGVRASVAPVAPDHPVLDLVGDRGLRAGEHPRQFREREPAADAVGDCLPFVQHHVICHVVCSFHFVAPARGRASRPCMEG